MPSGHFLASIERMDGRKHTQTLSNEPPIYAATMILFPRPRIHTSDEHKGCILVSRKPGADFRGCALPVLVCSFLATTPYPR